MVSELSEARRPDGQERADPAPLESRPPVALAASGGSAQTLPAAVVLGQIAAGAALLALAGVAVLAMLVGAGVIAAGRCGDETVYPLASREVPASLAPIYEQAAARYRLGAQGPAVLAAINKVETDFGRNLSTSSAGALGWMQFEPATWARYGVDGNADGSKDPRDPWDAIFAAAGYLAASGAPGNWHQAVFAYNHAAWYVAEVLALAAGYDGGGAGRSGIVAATIAPAGATCPAPASASGRLARILAEANRIDALRSVYVYGGGHVSPAPATPPWDCSAAWSRLLQAGGFAIPTMTSTGFMSWGDPGPGRYVTIYATPAHVYGTIGGRAWGTGDGNPRDPGGGPAWLPYTTNPIPGFPGGPPSVRHPPGL